MPKSLELLPEELFAPGKISFKDIPVNAYDKSIDEERELHGADGLRTVYHDMCVLREFETIINQVKLTGKYRDIEYTHAGPAHLSIGQEAAAVGMAHALNAEDWIFGSHRSHSEILAKGLAAIRELDDERLMDIMRGFFDGAILKVVERGHHGTVKELARKFLIYGVYAEIFARVTGFNRGWGGSMHAFFTPFGIYPNNAIVGGSGSIAPGAALFKRVNRKSGIVVANIGDASFGCGPVWEGIHFATMAQYRELWDEALGGGLPLIINCMDNHYGMGGQPAGETMGFKFLASLGVGVNPDQMHAERVNGYNPLAVVDAFRRKKQILLEGRGPVLLDTVTYRLSGHSPSDASSYRSKGELRRFTQADAIPAYAARLVEGGLASQEESDGVKAGVDDLVFDMFKLAVDLDISPREPLDSEYCATVMFSNQKIEKLGDRAVEVNHPYAQNPRARQIARKSRFAYDEKGKALSKMKVYDIRDAVFEAIMHRFYIDPTMIAFGEESRDWGGAFACYRGMTEALPYHRLFNTPISEAAIVGAACGYAMAGGRAVAELMYCDFLGRAGDEVFNQLSKWQAMSGGMIKMPVVVRVSVGAKYGAQHSQDWSALVHHIPGLKVVYPVTPYDTKGLLNAALAGTDPVIFLESQKVYDYGEMFHPGGVPADYYEIEIGDPDVKREGSDLTIITLGPMLYKALDAARTLESEHSISAEVIDLRSACPLDYDKLVASVEKTGKVLLANESVERGSVMQHVAATIAQLAFDSLDAPPVVVGARNWITPGAELESMFFPQAGWLLDAIHEKIIPLQGHMARSRQTPGELARRNRLGL